MAEAKLTAQVEKMALLESIIAQQDALLRTHSQPSQEVLPIPPFSVPAMRL